jgi:hypothetical protein
MFIIVFNAWLGQSCFFCALLCCVVLCCVVLLQVQNKIDDLYSLMKFLKHQPWDKWRW